MRSRFLPFDYAVRNLARRPLRTALTGLSSALVAALLVATVSFVRGLASSHAGAGEPDVAILLSRVSERDVLRSTVGAAVPELVAAAVPGIVSSGGVLAVSPEIHVGTRLRLGAEPPAGAPDPIHESFVRGITDRAFLVHGKVTVTEGRPPGPGEVLVGRLVPSKLGLPEELFAPGQLLRFENGVFRVSGRFAAPGTTVESELWAQVQDLKSLTRREDVSAIFVRMQPGASWVDLELFTRRRLDLELNVISSELYYQELAEWFAPIQGLVWLLAALMAGAAGFGGANTQNAAVQDRVRELATLRAVGYPGRALVLSLLQEGVVLAAAGGLLGLLAARALLAGATVSISMAAFELDVGPHAVAIAFAGVLLIAALGTLPAALRTQRLRIALALKET